MNNSLDNKKIVEDDLKKQNLLLTTILENAPIGFAVNTISDGKAIFIGSKFEEIYGVKHGSIKDVDTFFENVYIDPVYRKEIRKKITDDMNTGDPSKMVWENIIIKTTNGEKKYVTAMNIPVLDQNIMVSTVQDVTNQKNLEEKLKSELSQLEKLNKLMVGRELDMVKYKERITELENKLKS